MAMHPLLIVSFGFLLTSFLSGCKTASFGGESTSGAADGTLKASFNGHFVVCERGVKFQDKKITVKGIDFPISMDGANIVKVGETTIDPVKTREVTDIITLMDIRQYELCVADAKSGSKSEDFEKWYFEATNDFYKYVLNLSQNK